MTFLTEANEDAMSVTVDQAATGPRVGFLQAFENSYNAQTRASAMYGIENEMENIEGAQVNRMRAAGIDASEWAVLSFPRLGGYLDAARYYEDGGEPETAAGLKEFDTRIDKLREKYPDLGLMNSREMWEDVKSKAQMYEEKYNRSRTTIGGTLGNFIGGTIGAFNPESDPLNALTLNIGGMGKSVLSRVATQAGAQGAIEAVNQVTGVQEERRLLGLEYGLGDAVSRVGGAIVAGAAVQGVGEVVAGGIRRFFKSTPTDRAPDALPERPTLPDTSAIPREVIPADDNLAAAKLVRDPQSFENYVHEQSILSGTRAGRAVSRVELDYVTQKLDDWSGPRPWEMEPKTDTMIKPGTVATATPDMTRFVQKSQIDANARLIDPDTFAKYDALAARKETYRKWLDELGEGADATTQERLDALDTKIYDLTSRLENEGGKRAAKLRKEVYQLETEKAEVIRTATQTETPAKARVRAALLKDDIKMRELAPLVSRAYARANQKWVNTEGDRAAIHQMMREGKRNVELPLQEKNIIDTVEAALQDRAPILRSASRPDVKVTPGSSSSDVAMAVLAADSKIMSEAVERFQAQLATILKPEGKGTVKEYTGNDLRARLDNEFSQNATNLSEALATEVDAALKAGGKVTYYADGKAIPITSVSRGMMQDAKGQRWGTTPLLMQLDNSKPSLKIEGSTLVNVPGLKEPLDLDKTTIFIPIEDGEGGREVSLRALLQDVQNDKHEVEAVSSCSLR